MAAARCRILIVEDQPLLRRLLKTALLGQGFTVEDCGSGRAALRRLRRSRFDALLTDFQMPRMTGLELIEALRSTGSRMAILLMSTDSPGELGLESRTLRGVRFLRKPFGMKDLASALRRALRTSARSSRRRPPRRI